MKYNLIKSMVMPGGWHYMQGDHKIEGADSFEELIQNVIDYRIENKLTVGNVLEEVTQWICSTYPRQCNVLNTDYNGGPVIVNDTQAFLDNLTIWAQTKSRVNTKLVEPAVAEQRAYSCSHCVNNKSWDKQGCKSCIANLERLMIGVRQARDVSNPSRLGGCTALKHDNRTAVWVEDMPKETNLPPHCWCRKE